MKLKTIHIYGFGKWTNARWELGDKGLTVLFGYNESGKSTIMAFIQTILFGFPSKRDSFYQPRETNKYGGSLTIEQAEGRFLTIERVAGKTKKGKVSVQLPDGAVGGEEELQNFLDGMDLAAFKGIYHFDLEGLGGLKNLSPRALNRFLYDAGMSGADSLAELEKSIAGKTSRLFKPRGQKTELNVLAGKMHELDKTVGEWEQRLDNYEAIVQSKRMKETRLATVEQEQKTLHMQIRELDKRHSLSPLVGEWHALKQQEETSGSPVSFPADGVRRLEQLADKLADKEAEAAHGQQRLYKINEELKSLPEQILTNEYSDQVNDIMENFSVYRKMKEHAGSLQHEKSRLQQEQRAIEEEWQFGSELFIHAKATPYIFESYEKLKGNWQSLSLKEDHLEEKGEKLKREKQLARQQLEREKEELLTDKQVEELEKASALNRNLAVYEHEKTGLDDQLSRLTKEKDRIMKAEQSRFIQWLAAACVTFIASLVSYLTTDAVIYPFFLLLTLLSAVFMGMAAKRKKEEQRRIAEEEKVTENKIESLHRKVMEAEEMNEGDSARKLLSRHYERKAGTGAVSQKIEFISRQLEECSRERKTLEKKREVLVIQMKEWCKEANFPEGRTLLFYSGLLESVNNWKAAEREWELNRKKQEETKQELHQFEAIVKETAEAAQVQGCKEKTPEQTVTVLQQYAGKEKETLKLKKQLQEKAALHEEALERVKQETDILLSKKTELFKQAETSHEEAFREKGEQHSRHQSRTKRLHDLWVQITAIAPETTARDAVIHDIIYKERDEQEEQKQLLLKTDELEDEKKQLLNDLILLKNEMDELEEDGTYNELLQKYEIMHTGLNDKAKEWMVLKTAQYMIDKVKEIYEKERQPAVMKKAQTVFSRLTTGTYPFLFAPLGEERFVVERYDGQRFDPAELSRGTAELLYLSLRFGLALEDSMKSGFPLFMDETFVNMDKARREAIMELAADLAEERQLIVLTCHEHIVDEIKLAGKSPAVQNL